MGKKVKVGKQRKDKFYHLAKEIGFRSRAAFKLTQLNRRHQFLDNCRVCVDLCAAPGGWLQVAANNMHKASLIIGIDLVPIRAIPNVTTFQADITTEECRTLLASTLHHWKADIFLNDGAPNLGQNWIQDAFTQAELTLAALKLATEFLVKGGWFVTKIFRSKEYNSLKFVVDKMFKKVIVSKPAASRNESAEIFWVCKHYLAPDKIDPKFLDPRHVFKDAVVESKNKLSELLKPPSKKKPKAEGYEDVMIYKRMPASQFIYGDNHSEIIANAYELAMDDETIINHPLTTNEIKECCKDIKVLGPKELKSLLTWRQKLREQLVNKEKQEPKEAAEELDDEDEDAKLEEELKEINRKTQKERKLKQRKLLKNQTKLLEGTKDTDLLDQDDALFSISRIKTSKDMELIGEDQEPPEMELEPEDEEDQLDQRKPSYQYYDKNNLPYYHTEGDGEPMPSSDEEEDSDEAIYDDALRPSESEEEQDDNREMSSEDEGLPDSEMAEEVDDETDSDDESDDEEREDTDYDDDDEEEEDNPLVMKFDQSLDARCQEYFEQPMFKDTEDFTNLEIDLMQKSLQQQDSKKKKQGKEQPTKKGEKKTTKKPEATSAGNVSVPDSKENINRKKKLENDGDDNNEMEQPKPKKVKLSPEELAISNLLIRSKKSRRDLIDDSFNRYSNNDQGLPKWFVKDELKHFRKPLPVNMEDVHFYKDRFKKINTKTIKKVAEAKARKKRRAEKSKERAKKKTESVLDSDMTTGEKMNSIKSIYKKTKTADKKKKERAYVVATKGKPGTRPQGSKGRYRRVDKRMKKDNLRKKTNDKKRGRSKKR